MSIKIVTTQGQEVVLDGDGTWWDAATSGGLVVFGDEEGENVVAEFAPGTWMYVQKIEEVGS